MFPFNVVRIHLIGIPEKQAETFHSDFMEKYFDGELRAGLTRSNYRYPDDLRVEIETTPDLPGPKQAWISVSTEMTATPISPKESPNLATAVLAVQQGTADQAEIPLEKARTNIGRSVDVFKTAGPSRRNDVAFSSETAINRTVSREHAHITRDKNTGEYRLFNDRWYTMGVDAEANCGLWIVRDGLSQPVHRNSRGVALQDGDEIHFGRAIARFLVEPVERA